jgi:hypothetical protein
MPRSVRSSLLAAVAAQLVLLGTVPVAAQTPSVSPPAGTAPAEGAAPEVKAGESPLAPLAWLAGCWRGSVNQREFREHWLPLRGNLLVGAGHTTIGGRTQDFEYMRIESRPEGVHYVVAPSGKNEGAFKLVATETDGGDTIYPFENDGSEFPKRIVYRRGTEGWLYVTVEGKLAGQDRQVIYPLRRIDCESGEPLRQ